MNAEIIAALKLAGSLLTWLESRGLARKRSVTLLENAQGRDLTDLEVQTELDATKSEQDDIQREIDRMD